MFYDKKSIETIETKIRTFLEQMTLGEKIGQLNQVGNMLFLNYN